MRNTDEVALERGRSLLAETTEAHGGLERWAMAEKITTSVQARGLMPTIMFPGRPRDDYRYRQTVDAQRLHNVLEGVPTPDLTCTFSPEEVRVDQGGSTVARRAAPREAFRGVAGLRHVVRWDAVDTAYFLGYAMSNYLTHPYVFNRPDIGVRRGADARLEGETWRRLEVTHPEGFASHCREETFFIDDLGLIRRHEYAPDILPLARTIARVPGLRRGLTAAHFTSRHREVDGLVFPTFRRVMFALPGGPPLPGVTIICAQLSDITVSYSTSGTATPRSAVAPSTAPGRDPVLDTSSTVDGRTHTAVERR